MILNHFSVLLYTLENLQNPSQAGAVDVRPTEQEADICERNMGDIFKLYQINFVGRLLMCNSALSLLVSNKAIPSS